MISRECERMQRRVSAAQDGEGRNTPGLEAHLAHCSACRQFVETLQWAATEMRTSVPAPPPGLTEQAFARANRNRAGDADAPTPHRFWLAVPLTGVAVAALTAIVTTVHLPSAEWQTGTIPHVTHAPVSPPDTHAGKTKPRHNTGKPARITRKPAVGGTASPISPTLNRFRRSRSEGRETNDTWLTARAGGAVPTNPPPSTANPAKPLDDLEYINESPTEALIRWAGADVTNHNQAAFEVRLRQIVARPDDFILVPFPRLASLNSAEAVAAAEAQYRRDAMILDARLQRTIALAVAEQPFAEFCAELTARTGIVFSADPTTADENVILYCRNRTLRDVMRQISRHFGFTWRREPDPQGGKAYHYVLTQEMTGQLMEEEFRNRDRNEAILAIDQEMQRYRPFLSFSPDAILELAKQDRKRYLDIAREINAIAAKGHPVPPVQEKRLKNALTLVPGGQRYELLDTLHGFGWAPVHQYFTLTTEQRDALRRGELLRFSSAPQENETRLFPDVEQTLRTSLRDCAVLIGPQNTFSGSECAAQSLDMRVRDIEMPPEMKSVSRFGETPSDQYRYNLVTAPPGTTFVIATLQMVQTEPGRFELKGGAGFGHVRDGKPQGASQLIRSIALGVSPSTRNTDQRALQPMMTQLPGNAPSRLQTSLSFSPFLSVRAMPPEVHKEGEPQRGPYSMLMQKDALAALHKRLRCDILADSFGHLAAEYDLQIPAGTERAEALKRIGEAFRLRWRVETGENGNPWLLARSRTFFNDRLRAIPLRRLRAWGEKRQQQGYLGTEELAEIAQLSDDQLDSRDNQNLAVGAYNLWEWEFVQKKEYRVFWRFYCRLDSAQRSQMWSSKGLPVASLAPSQQDALLVLLHGSAVQQLSAWQRNSYLDSGRLYGCYVTIPEAEKALLADPDREEYKRIQPDVSVVFYWGQAGQGQGYQSVIGSNNVGHWKEWPPAGKP